MSEWVLVVVLLTSGRTTETPPRVTRALSIQSATIFRDEWSERARWRCEDALAAKERELHGQQYGLACLPAGTVR